jgi:multidrug efflux system membrane fusion protein
VQPDSTVTLRNVTVGATEGDDSEISAGLVPGDVVVLTGVDKLVEGSKVNAQIQDASASPAGPSQQPASNVGKGNGKGTKKGK